MHRFKDKKALPATKGHQPIQVCVVGAGPAGLMAAIQAARKKAQVVILEANQIPGAKLLLTGGGRCNLTHTGRPEQILRRLYPKDRFLRHAIYSYGPQWVRRFFKDIGIETYHGPDGRVFPVCDKAQDVCQALVIAANQARARLLLGRKALSIQRKDNGFTIQTTEETLLSSTLVLATGGLSYPQTGSTGDGLELAQALGHTIVPLRPGLVPLVTAQPWPGQLQGLSLQDVRLCGRFSSKHIITTSPLVFTADGIGGPAGLDMSRLIAHYSQGCPVELTMDLTPDLSRQDLEHLFIRWAIQHGARKVSTCLSQLIPRRLAVVVLQHVGCPDHLQMSQLQRDARNRIIQSIKAMPLTVRDTGPLEQAMVTIGGIDTTAIDPVTMQSNVCPGLFFAGEILDVDGPTGGYNLQICWSTGATAGHGAASALAI